ncbi:MAG: RNA 2'-phosphotransferase [Chloroflexota bacterium]
MKSSFFINQLAKFLAYVLGRQPDEFGLIPDKQGYVSIKDLMKVLAEEPGWRHVRFNHIREVMHTTRAPSVEMDNNRIRAVDRSHLVAPVIAEGLPKLLYCPVRRRAYPLLQEKGQLPAAWNRILLADDLAMAQRLGRRIDPSPVILTVNGDQARRKGATIWRFGKRLFILDGLPAGSFSGPPLPKTRTERRPARIPDGPVAPKTPGSYFIDLSSGPGSPKIRTSKGAPRHKNEWKRDRRRKRQNQTRFRGEPA